MMKSKPTQENAAITIQSTFRGFFSRKKTNIYGASQGKEIEIYIPLGIKKMGRRVASYNLPGRYKTILCKSDLFNIQIDHMNFNKRSTLSIAEIVTTPFKRSGNHDTNLPYSEEDIDAAVYDFLSIIECFATKFAHNEASAGFLRLNKIMETYNEKHSKHPLRLNTVFKNYFAKPDVHSLLLIDSEDPDKDVKLHTDSEICFIFNKNIYPIFDKTQTPRTDNAAKIIDDNLYQEGKLLVHIQKTFSLAVQDYTPENFSKEKNPDLHSTDQQLEYLNDAHKRGETLLEKHPLPASANPAKILGLLTICAEQALTVIHAQEYKNLHEKADRPIVSIRHILHYIKNHICNEDEINWFNDVFFYHREDINTILCDGKYEPDYRERADGYGPLMRHK